VDDSFGGAVDMAERTHNPDSSNTPDAYGWCAWHGEFAFGIRLIHAREQGSGSGGGTFACPPCREEHGLVPFADRPL
jgi:hypothetical protein